MDGRQAKILGLLATYVSLKPSELFTGLELRRDLQLEPLDVVLFALDLETGREPAFPFERLDGVRTVGELLTLVTGWLDEDAREAREARSFDEAPRTLPRRRLDLRRLHSIV